MAEACRNCGAELEGLESCWASRDGLFCSEDCGVLFNYTGSPITDDYTCLALAIEAQQPFEIIVETLERLQFAATQRWNETAEEINPADIIKSGSKTCPACGTILGTLDTTYVVVDTEYCDRDCAEHDYAAANMTLPKNAGHIKTKEDTGNE